MLTAIALAPGGGSTVHTYTQTIHRTTQITTEQHKKQLMWKSSDRFYEFYRGICLTTEERARKNHSQVKRNLRVQYTYYQNTHTVQNPDKHTHYRTM